jgi:heme/copper-type cytochrome/quinol oxidase subunit 3
MLREAKRLVLRMCGSKRGVLLNILAVLFVSWGLPWFLGVQFLRAMVLIPLASLSVFLVGDSVVDSFGGTFSGAGFAATVSACVFVGWSCGLAIVTGGIAALNAMLWTGAPMLPPAVILIDAAVVSLASSVLVAGAALTVCRKFNSANSARLVLKLVMLTVVLGLLYGCNKAQAEGLLIPTTERITRLSLFGSIFFLANGAALIALASNDPRFRRPGTPAGSS